MSNVRVCVEGSSITLFSTSGSSTISSTGTVPGPVSITTVEGPVVSVIISGGDAVFSVDSVTQSPLMLVPDSAGQCASLS